MKNAGARAVQPLAETLQTGDCSCEKERYFSLRMCFWCAEHAMMEGHTSQRTWEAQIGLELIKRNKQKSRHKVRWVGKGGESKRGCGRRVNGIKIRCTKLSNKK